MVGIVEPGQFSAFFCELLQHYVSDVDGPTARRSQVPQVTIFPSPPWGQFPLRILHFSRPRAIKKIKLARNLAEENRKEATIRAQVHDVREKVEYRLDE
jgi:hypothetical protein